MNCEILIAPVFARAKFHFFPFAFRQPIQGKKFELGLRIMNLGMTPCSGFRLSNIRIESKNGQGVNHTIDMFFSVKQLNPGESTYIWADRMRVLLDGLVWISGTIEPEKPEEVIQAFQLTGSKKPEKYPNGTNKWGNGFVIESRYNHGQKITNGLLLLLAVLELLKGDYGITDFLKAIPAWAGGLLIAAGNWLVKP